MAWGKPTPTAAPAARAATKKNVKPQEPLEAIHLDGMVVMKVIKHCQDNVPQTVTGSLLGVNVKTVLEVTNSFAFPVENEDTIPGTVIDEDAHQAEMMKMMREVNMDNNTIGWYTSSFNGSFCTPELVETQYDYQTMYGDNCVVIVYDPIMSAESSLSMRAFRLTKFFMQSYAQNGDNFTDEMLADNKLDSNAILEEIPVMIRNAPLMKALLFDLKKKYGTNNADKSLQLNINPFLEKNMESLIGSVSMLTAEQQKFQRHDRDVVRLKQQRSAWLQERRMENAKRKEAGLGPLPEVPEPSNPLFNNIEAPSRLNSLLLAKQVSTYCGQVNQFSGNSFSKLFLAGSFHKKSA